MTSDGGTNASYGFRRQFLVTAEAVLRTLRGDSVDPGAVAVLIEPTCSDLGGTEGVDDDIVDFAIEAHGAIVRRVQVKSRIPSGMNPLRYSDASLIFRGMGSGAREAVILTNKPPAKKLLQACAPPAAAPEAGASVYTVTARTHCRREHADAARRPRHPQRPAGYTRNEHLSWMIADLRPHSARLRIIAHSHPDRLEVSLNEHLAMCSAIVDHDATAAVAACTEHLTQTQKTILDAVLNPDAAAMPVDIVTN